MTNLTANKPRKFQGLKATKVVYPMAANSQLFAGAALMMDASTGYPAVCVATASGKFLGFASEWKDNRTGSPYGGLDGSTTIEVETSGLVWLTMTRSTSTWAKTDYGATVYATDSDSFAESAGTNLIPIGKIELVPEAAVGAATADILVRFEASSERSI